jgi:hypothetical protein
MVNPPKAECFGKFRMREAKVKGNVAGEEIRLKPRNQTSVRFKFGAMVKVASLAENIPQSGAENQMK